MATAALLLIGNELLSGKVEEANLAELAKLLRRLGVDFRRAVMVNCFWRNITHNGFLIFWL